MNPAESDLPRSTSDQATPGATPPKRRWVTSVDLGALRPEVERACAGAGLCPSTWLKDLVRREVAEMPVAERAPIAERGETAYRAALDADLVAKLDERVRSDGLRDRAAGLRALIEGAVLLPKSGDVPLPGRGRPGPAQRPIDSAVATHVPGCTIALRLNICRRPARHASGGLRDPRAHGCRLRPIDSTSSAAQAPCPLNLNDRPPSPKETTTACCANGARALSSACRRKARPNAAVASCSALPPWRSQAAKSASACYRRCALRRPRSWSRSLAEEEA